MTFDLFDSERLERIAVALERIAERQPVWQYSEYGGRARRMCVCCGSVQEFIWPDSRSGHWEDIPGSGPGCPRCRGSK